MANTATISFKTTPEHMAIIAALARNQRQTVSAFIRLTVEQALDLDARAQHLSDYLARTDESPST